MTAVVFVKTLRRRPYDGHRFAYNDPQSPVSWRGVAVTREGEARIQGVVGWEKRNGTLEYVLQTLSFPGNRRLLVF